MPGVTRTKPRFGFVVEYVKEIEEATRFYVDVMGLEVQRAAPNFVQFETFALASDQPVGSGDVSELYWLVDDAEAAFNEMSSQATVAMPLTQMPFGRLFAINDPAGRPRYILQLAQDRPSEAV